VIRALTNLEFRRLVGVGASRQTPLDPGRRAPDAALD